MEVFMHFSKLEIYKLFFLLLRTYYVFSILFVLKLAFETIDLLSGLLSSFGLLIIVIQFFASLKAERLIKEENYNGLLLGLVLSFFILSGFGMPIALLGFYALLNKEMRSLFSNERLPSWLKDAFLTLDNISFSRG
jgi:hypothetical protein